MKKLLLHIIIALGAFSIGTTCTAFLNREDRLNPDISTDAVIDLNFRGLTAPPREFDFATAAVAAPAPIPLSATQFDYDREQLVPDGTYYIHGSAPRDFAEFDSFEIWTAYDEVNATGGVQVYSASAAGLGTNDIAFALLTTKRLYFLTKPSAEGVEYKFDGKFLRGGVLSDLAETVPLLEGKLTKLKDGKKIAERAVKFSITSHGC
jgi:hypothetical protein